jgi:SAM-dependent methyltransferase
MPDPTSAGQMTDTGDALAREREHQDAWYSRAIAEGFFEREGFRRLQAWNLERLRRAIPLGPSSRVLSLGCGSGEYERLLAPCVRRLTAVDLSPVAIAEAGRRAAAGDLRNLEFVEASLLEVSLPEAAFDVVYALGVLHHLAPGDRQALLARVRRWLVPGGRFYARDPSARGVLRRLGGWCCRRSAFHSPNEAALEPRAMRAALVAAGFREVAVGFTDVLAGPLPWLTASRSLLLWGAVFAIDLAWLATQGLRRLASQFDVRASR